MPSTKRFQVRVGFGYADWWRRLWMALPLSVPLLLSLASLAPTARAPHAGELFHPSDLRYPWWTATLWTAFIAAAVGGVSWRVLARRSGPPARREATLTTDADGFSIDEGRYAKRDIEHVFVDGDRVIVRMRHGREISIASAREVNPIFSALHPDPAKQRAAVPIAPIGSIAGKLVTAVFAIALLLVVIATASIGEAILQGRFDLSSLGYLAGYWVALALSGLMLRRRTAVIGSDGVRIDGVWGRRFIPHADVARVSEEDGVVKLERHRGFDVSLPTLPNGGGLRRRIAMARALPEVARDTVIALERGDKSAAEWRDALHALGRNRSYRSSALRVEDLDDIVRDPSAPPRQRIAAAVTLAAGGSHGDRIRIAADACADPDLAAALEAAADGEIAERRLARCEARHRAAHISSERTSPRGTPS